MEKIEKLLIELEDRKKEAEDVINGFYTPTANTFYNVNGTTNYKKVEMFVDELITYMDEDGKNISEQINKLFKDFFFLTTDILKIYCNSSDRNYHSYLLLAGRVEKLTPAEPDNESVFDLFIGLKKEEVPFSSNMNEWYEEFDKLYCATTVEFKTSFYNDLKASIDKYIKKNNYSLIDNEAYLKLVISRYDSLISSLKRIYLNSKVGRYE